MGRIPSSKRFKPYTHSPCLHSACLLHTIPHQSHLNYPGRNTQSPQTLYKKKYCTRVHSRAYIHTHTALCTAAYQPLIDKQYIIVACTPAPASFAIGVWISPFLGKINGRPTGENRPAVSICPCFDVSAHAPRQPNRGSVCVWECVRCRVLDERRLCREVVVRQQRNSF